MTTNEKKKSILIVDDDPFLLSMYSQKFSEQGFEVHTAVDGREGLAFLEGATVPDVLLLDLVMPAVGGFEMLSELKKRPSMNTMLIIVLSNLGEEKDRVYAKRLGAHGYVVKASVTPQEVVHITVKMLAEKRITSAYVKPEIESTSVH